MAVVTMESPFHSAGPVAVDSVYAVEPRRRRWAVAVGLALIALVLVAALVWALRPDGSPKTDAPGVPGNVPAKYQPSLSDLHDAVNGGAR